MNASKKILMFLAIHSILLLALQETYKILAIDIFWADWIVECNFNITIWVIVFFLDLFGKQRLANVLLLGHMMFVLLGPQLYLMEFRHEGISFEVIDGLCTWYENALVKDELIHNPYSKWIEIELLTSIICYIIIGILPKKESK